MFADQVLAFFAEHADSHWLEALGSVESDEDSVAQTQARVLDILAANGWTEPVGTYVGSYVAIKETLPESQHDEAIEAIRYLKERFRLVQHGRGRGKAIIVLSTEPLPEPPPSETPPLDADAALRQIRDSYIGMQNYVKALEAKNEDLQLQLESANERIEQLYVRLDGKVPATQDW